MRIKKLQGGGIAPFMSYTPNVASTPAMQSPTATSTTTEQEEKQQLLNDDMIKLIMNEGIPSDVENFMSQLDNFSNSIYGGIQNMDSSQLYSMLLPQLNKIKYNKQELMDAKDELYSNGGLNEVAITANGGIVVQTETGSPDIISIEEYSKDPSKFATMNNNDLLNLRSYDNSLAFNHNIVGVLRNGQGINNVTKELQTVISQMKLQKYQKQEFMSTEQLEVLKGIDVMKGIAEVNTSQESSRVYKEHAKEYLFNMLPQNSKNLLRVKAAQRGITEKEMMELLILPSTQESITQEVDLNGAGGGSGSGAGGSSTRELTWLDSYVGNTMGVNRDGSMIKHEFNIGDGFSIMAPAIALNSLHNVSNGQPLNRNSSIGTIVRDAFGGIGDSSNVYFGNDKISADKLDNIVATGENMSKAYLPIDKSYYDKTGNIKPDLEISNMMKDAEKQIKLRGAKTPEEKQVIYEELGLGDYFTTNPQENKDLFAPFAIIPSWAQGEGVVKNKSSMFLSEVSGDDEDIRRLLEEGKLGRKQNSGDTEYLKGFWNWGSDTDIYQSLAFIHTPDDIHAASASGNYLTVPKGYGNYEHVMQVQAASDRKIKNKNLVTNSNILNG